MTIKNFPSDLGWTVGSAFTDSSPFNFGTLFALTASANITAVRVYAPVAQTVTGQLWANGSKVAEVTGVSLSVGWNTITFTTPYAGTTGVDYIVSALVSSGTSNYTAVANKFTDGTNPVTVTVSPATSNTSSNNLFVYGTGVPSSQFGTQGMWLGVDAVIDDLASGNATVTAVRATATAAAGTPTVTGTSPGALVAVRATATAAARVPTVAGTLNGSVAAVRATALAAVPIPAIDVTVTLTGGGAATATAAAIAPVVSGASAGQVIAVRATATGTARAPSTNAIATITVQAVRATASALAIPANPTGVSVTAVPASTGSVKGWIATGVNVAPDADGYPDLIAAVGSITFVPVAKVVLVPGASPAPLVLVPKQVVATLDSSGYLVGTKIAERLVRLITGQWTVTYNLTGIQLPSHVITIAANVLYDLTELIPT